jgi:iron complex transport system ATP-binding protein
MAPQAGDVRLNGRPLTHLRRREIAHHLAYVPQIHTIAFPYTVHDVIMLGRFPENGLIRAPDQHDRDQVAKALERLEITHLADRPYTELSGGERQLALIGRALAQDAQILVMDEPMSGLDYGYQIRLIDHLNRLAEDGRSVLMSTHHPEHALWAATRVALLLGGRIDADGPPAEVLTPEAIRRLYRVGVMAVHSATGQTAFFPERRINRCES